MNSTAELSLTGIPENFVIVTIDGGAAAGKSSTAAALARQHRLLHVDTGSHYRAVTLALVEQGVNLGDVEAVAATLSRVDLGVNVVDTRAAVTIGGHQPEPHELRSEAVNRHVSAVAAFPVVRDFLREYQRGHATLAAGQGFRGLVMEGRDIGSVIFPDAPLRYFLEASADCRQQRRAAEGQIDGVAERDRQDSGRKAAPLICPEGAQRIQSDTLSLEDVVTMIEADLAAWFVGMEEIE